MENLVNSFILKIFPLKSMPYCIATIIIVFILFIIALIFIIPKVIENNIKQGREYKSNHQLQVESYFRDLSGDEVRDLFSRWADAVVDLDNFTRSVNGVGLDESKKLDYLNSLIKDTVLYGSTTTLKLVASYQNYVYIYGENLDGLKMLAYVAKITSSLKFDFSGYSIDPGYLLKLKITDYNERKDTFKAFFKEIDKEASFI